MNKNLYISWFLGALFYTFLVMNYVEGNLSSNMFFVLSLSIVFILIIIKGVKERRDERDKSKV